MKKITLLLLSTVIIIAAFIRLYQIGGVPASPDWDEAALGYNAYSVLLTGRDEYGKFLPIVLQSFDDYKPALYAYLVIPFISIFDLSVISVRLPSVLFGVLGIIAVFFIVRELFQNGLQISKVRIKKDHLSLLTAFLVAISPWHIQFSRVGFEANVGLSFNLFALLFFLKALKNKYLLPFSFFFGAVNVYVYQSEKVYTPLLFLIMIAVFWKEFIKIPKKWIGISFFVGLLVVIPMLIFILTNPHALARAKGVSVFSDTEKLLTSNTAKINRDHANNDYLGLFLDNRRVEYVRTFTLGYLSHFQPNWLFYKGDVSRHHAPYMGPLYLWTLPFVLIGLYLLFFSDIPKRIKWFLLLWILIVPLPASITIDVPHAVRAINFIPLFDLLTALGLIFMVSKVNRATLPFRLAIFVCLAGIIALNTLYYLNQYFVQLNYYDSKDWQYGWKEAVSYVDQNRNKFDQIVISNKSPLDQSYVFFLFYLKYDPARYQKEGGTKSGGFAKDHTAFGDLVFRPIDWNRDRFMKNTLFLGQIDDLPDNRGMVIYYLNGEPAIVFSERHE